MSILVSIFLWKVSKYKHLSCWSKGSTLVFYCDFPDQLFCRAPTSFIKLPRDNSCSEEFQLGGLGFLSNNGSFWGSWFAVGNISNISTNFHQWFSHPHYNHCLLMLVLFLHSLHSLHSLYFVTRKYGVVPYWIHSSSDEEFEKILLSDRSSHQKCSRKILQILQNSQENSCVRVYFLLKLQVTFLPATLLTLFRMGGGKKAPLPIFPL